MYFMDESSGFRNRGYQIALALLFTLAPRYVAIITIVSHHLHPFVWDMGTHGTEPFQGIKDFLVLRCPKKRTFGVSFLGKSRLPFFCPKRPISQIKLIVISLLNAAFFMACLARQGNRAGNIQAPVR